MLLHSVKTIALDLLFSSPGTDNLLDQPWLALNIGNSRLHWGLFVQGNLVYTWEQFHIDQPAAPRTAAACDRYQEQLTAGCHPDALNLIAALPELWVASVVPEQTAFWHDYPQVHLISLEQIPLTTYPTLGIDRALALWEAGTCYGWPALVMDAGTALTLTGANANGELVGGAILPGLGLQLQALEFKTAALPQVNLPEELPPHWATSTTLAMQSGVIYTLLAGIQHFVEVWLQQWPESQIVITGGDRTQLHAYLKGWFAQQSSTPMWVKQVIQDPHLVLQGLRSLRQFLTHSEPNS